MCGFVGFWSQRNDFNIQETIDKMTNVLTHRGPNNQSSWYDEYLGLALGHTRLSILDLSVSANQPMHSQCGRFSLVFNGEIYNHMALRKKLSFESNIIVWKTQSDTETLLACLLFWGLEKTLKNIIGMFAFAFWDKEKKQLSLARDRVGEKPLYYGWQGNTFLFGSELKSFRVHPHFKGVINREALGQYFRLSYIPSPKSIYYDIQKLNPSEYIQINLDSSDKDTIKPKTYWSLSQVILSGKSNAFNGSSDEAVSLLESNIEKSINRQMISDVPLGAFLSGGIDSSTVVTLMQKQSAKPIKTFTIGFNEENFNEAMQAKKIADYLRTEHTELYVSHNDALKIIPNLPNIYCEPFADSSQIPSFLISSLAKSKVSVALSGDGGDELFAGYNRYLVGYKNWRKLKCIPLVFRKVLAQVLTNTPPRYWDMAFDKIKRFIPPKYHTNMIGLKAYKVGKTIGITQSVDFYKQLINQWDMPPTFVLDSKKDVLLSQEMESEFSQESFEEWMMAIDLKTYMADDILVKLDRAAMANSLETRVPFLDPDVIKLAWQLPLKYKIHEGQGKWILRQVLYRHLPKEFVENPKKGFAVPLAKWISGPLREWVDPLIDKVRLKQEGYMDADVVHKMWDEHINEKQNWQLPLWNIFMFQAWLDSINA